MHTTFPTGSASGDFTIVRRRHIGRWVAGAVVLGILAMLVQSMVANPRFGWDVVGLYFRDVAIMGGIAMTLQLTFISMAIGVVLGVALAIMRMSANPVVSLLARGFVATFRGTPLLVQLLIWYNLAALYPVITLGIPGVALNANELITPFMAAILGLALNEAAYMSEIVRAGIISVDRGQQEAATAGGLTRAQILRYIVLPQAMRVIIPPTGNELVGMLKATSLVSVIAVADLLYASQIIYARNFQVIPLLIVASIWYIIMTTVLNFFQGILERHYARGSDQHNRTRPPWERVKRMFRHHAPLALGKDVTR